MDIKPKGFLARQMLDTIEQAELMQGKAVAMIADQYAAERHEELSMENLTWDKFMKELADAETNGTLEQFNDTVIRNLLTPVIQQVMAPPQEGQQ